MSPSVTKSADDEDFSDENTKLIPEVPSLPCSPESRNPMNQGY